MVDIYRSAVYRTGSLKGILFDNRKSLTPEKLNEYSQCVTELTEFLEGRRDSMNDVRFRKMNSEMLYRVKELCDAEIRRRRRQAVNSWAKPK